MSSRANVPAAREISVRNPRTGRSDCRVRALNLTEVGHIADRLRANQPAWASVGAATRASVVKAWSSRLLASSGPVLDALSTDTGRHLLAAREIDALRGIVAGNIALSEQLLCESPERPSVTPGVGIRIQHVPYGLVGVISPWNFPFLLAMLDTIPALIAGCAVIVKPSEVTPRFIAPLQASIDEFPELAGVCRFISGDGETGAALIDNSDAVCFTGSVATGRKVADACARRFIPAFLELGGKDPVIVLASADPDRAAAIVLRASVQATGQACQSLERVYVDERVADPFIDRLVAQANAVALNYPDSRRGQIGPLIFERQAEVIAEHLADAVSKGATVLTGGVIENHGGGRWLRPTVVTGVTHDMRLMSEETFGPVIPVMRFTTIDEGVRLANESVYGLSASVLGEEREAIAVAGRLEVGSISINDGGLTTEVFDAEKHAFKFSGLGASRMGPSGLMRFIRKKALLIQHGVAKDMSTLAEEAAPLRKPT